METQGTKSIKIQKDSWMIATPDPHSMSLLVCDHATSGAFGAAAAHVAMGEEQVVEKWKGEN